MKISVISVCFNEEKSIAKTIESVLNQTSDSYEYIICDGKSTDSTVAICHSYEEQFKKKNIDFKIISEKDGGIYFGMNNGIDLARGDYVIFMNAGDCFHDTEVIANIVARTADKSPAVIYGDCMFVDRCVTTVVSADHNRLKDEMTICHQSILIRTDIIKERKFNTKYRIGADYDMVLGLYISKCEFLKMDLVIADFYAGGLSSVNLVKATEEQCRIKDQYNLPYDRAQALSAAKKNEIIIKIKRKMPFFLWKFWSKTIKKKQWIES